MSSSRPAPRLEPRAGQARCAVCHDGAELAEPCDGCGALTHDECLLEAGGCPTLGCAWAGEVDEPRPDPKAGSTDAPVAAADEADRRLPAALPALVVVGLLLFVLTAFADRFVWVHGRRIDDDTWRLLRERVDW